MFCKHNPSHTSTGRNSSHDTSRAWETGDWSTTAVPSARKSLVKKFPHIVTPVRWHAILFENDKQLEFFQLWDHTQLIMSDTPCDSFLIKGIWVCPPIVHHILSYGLLWTSSHITCVFLVPHIWTWRQVTCPDMWKAASSENNSHFR
jgi:hypothetical protein